MFKVIYLYHERGGFEETDRLKTRTELFTTDQPRDAVYQLLNHPDTSVFLIEPAAVPEGLNTYLDKVKMLNPLIKIILISRNHAMLSRNYIEKYDLSFLPELKTDSVMEIIDVSQQNRRRFNRVNWPLTACYYSTQNIVSKDGKSCRGNVVSFSIGGAYIQASDFELVKQGFPLLLEIKFEDFQFFAEAVVVRVNTAPAGKFPAGFSVEFVNTSMATKAAINQLVNNKILQDLFKNFQEEAKPEVKK